MENCSGSDAWLRRRAWRLALAAGASAVAMSGAASAQVLDDEEEEEFEVMEVTGSRLNTNTNLVSPSPVLQVSSEEIDARGTIRIEDLTNVLPQAFAGQTSEIANGATGTSNLNLRGLGSIRTLVLIDGKRLPFGSPLASAANLDLVPTQLIERIDIVTGGASAVYGSDAIGGVANFILKDDFEGVEFDGQVGFYHAGNNNELFESILETSAQPIPSAAVDGRDVFATLTMGINAPDGRGNITMHLTYQNQNEIVQGNRVSSACTLGPNTGTFSVEGLACVGSANFRLFAGNPQAFDLNADGSITGADSLALFQQLDGELTQFAGGPFETFNFGAQNFFQRPNERFNFYTKGHYDITDDIEVFLDLNLVNNSTDAQIAPSATFGGSTIGCQNPFLQDDLVTLPAGALNLDGSPAPATTNLFTAIGCGLPGADGSLPDSVTVVASHRNVEGGPRNSNIDLTTFRAVTGFRGTFLENIDFEVFGQFARTLLTDIATEDFVVDNVTEAFDVVLDADGEPVCASGNPACVPYNIFERGPNGETLVTPEALNFVVGDSITTGETQQIVLGGTFQTDLGEYGVKSPFTENGISVLIGAEYREDSLEVLADSITADPDGGFTGVGGGTPPSDGEVRVVEGFLEAQIPLISGAFLAEELAVGGAYRFSAYTTEGIIDFATGEAAENSFDTSSFFAYVNWTPEEQFRLRAQFQRAIRSPNVIELFDAVTTGLVNLSTLPTGFSDPCAGPSPTASFAACANTGVTASQFGGITDVISGQANSISGGNPFLDPEVSDTITAGIVITPNFIPGLTLSIDYFNVSIDDVIATIPAQTILDECLSSGLEAFCSLIQRDPSGSLAALVPGTGFTATLQNIAELSTTGIDFQILYTLDLADFGFGDLGTVNFDYASTYLRSLDFVPAPGLDTIEFQGFFAGSAGTPNPFYRHRLLTTWQTPWNLSLTTTWRFFSSVDVFPNADGSLPGAPLEAELSTINYIDFAAFYELTENIGFRFGVNNLTGREAPVTTQGGPPFFSGNTAPGVYDATGRFVFFGVNFRL